MKEPCEMCLNARVSGGELTDENDYHARTIGFAQKGNRLLASAGWGRGLTIQAEAWNEERQQWEAVAIYHPKHCPNCGRELKEYGPLKDGVSDGGQ